MTDTLTVSTRALTAFASIVVDLSRGVESDFVGIWEIVKLLSIYLPEVEANRRTQFGEAILRALVDSGVQIGDLDGSTGSFTAWTSSDPVSDAITKWSALGRDPDIGDIAYLVRLPDERGKI